MATTTKKPPKKVIYPLLPTYEEQQRQSQRLELIETRLCSIDDRLAGRDAAPPEPGDNAQEQKTEKDCSCAKKAAMHYLEGLLWGTVIGLTVAAIYFERSVRRRLIIA